MKLILLAATLLAGCATPGVETQASRDRFNCEYTAHWDESGAARSIMLTRKMMEVCDK